ncbi:MAG: Calx-beta domain-containing protein [Planctomycetota bacterium]
MHENQSGSKANGTPRPRNRLLRSLTPALLLLAACDDLYDFKFFDSTGITSSSGPSLGFGSSSLEISEDSGEVTALVRLYTSGTPLDGPVTVEYFTEDDTAVQGEDYAATSGKLTFPVDGVKTLNIRIAIHDDAKTEGPESFFLRMRNARGARIVNSSMKITIQDPQDRGLRLQPILMIVIEGDQPALLVPFPHIDRQCPRCLQSHQSLTAVVPHTRIARPQTLQVEATTHKQRGIGNR